MKKRNSLICLILCVCILCTLTGCYDSVEVNDLAYTVTVGLDKGKEDTILVTFQFVLPNGLGGGSGSSGGESSGGSSGGGGEEETPSGIKIITVEAATISNAIEIANDFLSKKVSLSHAVMVIMGMDFAKENLDTYWKEIFMSNDFNPDMYVAVCKEDAKSFIEKINPKLDVNPAEYLEYTINSKSTVMTTTGNIYEIFTRTLSDSGDAYATMCAISENKENIKDENDLSADDVASEQYTAGNLPKAGGPETEFVGLAVFSNQEFVGDLTASESWMVIATEGKLESKSKTIEDPEKDGAYIGATLEQEVNPKIKVDTSSDVPVISVRLPFTADIYSVQSEKATSHADYDKIVKHLTAQLEAEFQAFYEKLAGEYHSDILRFGMFAKKNFSTIQEWEAYNWREKYPNARFNVNVDITVQRQDMYLA